jgi:hypothetical protein
VSRTDGGREVPAHDGRDETELERLDRNWQDLLQELRVAQTGVQILTGFLLTVPFQQRFDELGAGQKDLYLALVVGATLTTGLLIAPVSMHRILFRQGRKRVLVALANALAMAGLLLLCLEVCGVLLFVFDVVTGLTTALRVSVVVLAALLLGWFVVPLLARRHLS